MKKYFVMCVLVVFGFVLSGCESLSGTEKGAIGGGVAGAGIGGIIGHQSGHGGAGAAIGGAAGALLGGLVGHNMDKRQAQVNPNHLSITRIAEMAEDGVPSAAIIDEIRQTRSVYSLDSETITYLKNHSVSDSVIDYMMATSK